MAILAECPRCKRKQGNDNDLCLSCGQDMKKLKKSGNVRYWISYYIPDGRDKSGKVKYRQRRELVGTSITEARAAAGKRSGQKRENRFSWDMLAGTDMTFGELVEWYLNLEDVKELKAFASTYCRVQNFNKVYGSRLLSEIKNIDLTNYQRIRSQQGIKNTTIDTEMREVKRIINLAWMNDMVSGKILKTFKNVEIKKGRDEGIRRRTITLDEYFRLIEHATGQERCKIIIAMHTGVRPGEIKGLQWRFIDRKAGFITLPADYTKEQRERHIPINHHVKSALDQLGKVKHITHVFPYGRRIPSKYTGPSVAFRTICKNARVPYGRHDPNVIIAHDFRRTFKTNCVSAGIGSALRNALLGHGQEGMDKHYVHPSKEDLQNAMERYTSWFDGRVAESSDQTSDQAI